MVRSLIWKLIVKQMIFHVFFSSVEDFKMGKMWAADDDAATEFIYSKK